MRTIISAIVLAFSLSSNANPFQQYYHQAIVNGERVSGTLYPWMVSLRAVYSGFTFEENPSVEYYSRFCGGSLISLTPITILTAAHCVDFFEYDNALNSITEGGDAITLYADLGRTKGPHVYNTYDESGDTFITLTVPDLISIHIHDRWTSTEVGEGYDIALIIINDGQTLPTNYAVANIPNQKLITEECCPDNEILTALGYGLDDDEADSGEPTDTMERITMEYHPSEECLEYMWLFSGNSLPIPPHIERPSNDQVCARGNDADICQGDSGGPIFRVLGGGEIEIVGVSSYVMGSNDDKCNTASHPLPSFFTSVAHYNTWINATMAGASYTYPTNEPTISYAPTVYVPTIPTVAPTNIPTSIELLVDDDTGSPTAAAGEAIIDDGLIGRLVDKFGMYFWIAIGVILVVLLVTWGCCVFCILAFILNDDDD